MPAFQLAGKKEIFVLHNSKKPLRALTPPSLCVVSVLKSCRSAPEFGPLWIDHYAGCSQTYTAGCMWRRIISKGRNACLAALPSLQVSADFSPFFFFIFPVWFFFFFGCLCHLIFKPDFYLLCQCKSGQSLQTDIKWACACFGALLSDNLDILQQMGVGIGDCTSLPAVLSPLWISWSLFDVCLVSRQLREDRSMLKKRNS